MGASEDMELKDMVMAMVVAMVAKEDVEEGAMITTHMNFPAGAKYLWDRYVYTLHTNGDSSPCNKRLIFKK